MPLIIILAGIPGSGKTTLLEESIKLLPQLKIINYGDMMLKEAYSYNLDKDQLRHLPLKQQQKIGIEAAKNISRTPDEIVCIDTHAMINTPFGYCPGISQEVIALLNPNVIGMVECSPSQILLRRKRDGSRNRDEESIEQIEYHQQISRSFLIACSALSGAVFAPIMNHRLPSEAATQFVSLIRSML